MLLLKKLSDALRDNDPVYAVIIGTGANQDGNTNGITVPNPEAQKTLILEVCKRAGVMPGDLQYVEAHGTGTPVGDPIEANTLGEVLTIGRKPGAPCYIGSVKTNIGHAESAVGLAALWKTCHITPDAIVGHSTGEVAAFYEDSQTAVFPALFSTFHISFFNLRSIYSNSSSCLKGFEKQSEKPAFNKSAFIPFTAAADMAMTGVWVLN